MSDRSGNVQSFVPGAAVPQGRFVKLTTAGKVIVAAVRGDNCIGVSLEAGAADADPTIAVALLGTGAVVEVEAGEAVAIGDNVCPHTDGSAMDADTTGDAILGKAISAAAADGEFCSVLLQGAPVLTL